MRKILRYHNRIKFTSRITKLAILNANPDFCKIRVQDIGAVTRAVHQAIV